jgi:hypothetical protein
MDHFELSAFNGLNESGNEINVDWRWIFLEND